MGKKFQLYSNARQTLYAIFYLIIVVDFSQTMLIKNAMELALFLFATFISVDRK